VPAVIYEADRVVIAAALLRPGSKARNERALAITKFRAIGRQVWPNREPNLPGGIA
jgi:hypothetical protein